MTFILHPRLADDTLPLGDLALCRALLMNDARFPWLLLVPRRADLRELSDLTAAERSTLMEEVASTSRIVQEITGAYKMNVGAIGNIISQLHVHIVARFEADAAWPAPVWGFGRTRAYTGTEAKTLASTLITALDIPH